MTADDQGIIYEWTTHSNSYFSGGRQRRQVKMLNLSNEIFEEDTKIKINSILGTS